MDKNLQIAQAVLEAVGGKDNVTFVTHCMTRLRFNFKDESLVNDTAVGAVSGVIGVVKNGGQYQVIIGQNVPKVYAHLCQLGGFKAEEAINENLDENKKSSVKGIGNNILDYLSGTMAALIPSMIAAAMFKTLLVLLGPDMLKVFTAESDMYILCDFIYDSFFYFLPIYIGYAGAKKLGSNVTIGMLLGAITIAPDFAALVGVKETLTIYGLFPAAVASYGSALLPLLVAMPIAAAVEKGLKKIIPDVLSTVFVPFLTVFVMIPILLCVCCPIGNTLGAILGNALIAFGDFGGFIAVAVVAALWEFLVMTGMHGVMIMFAITNLFATGCDTFILTAGGCATWAAFGMALGAFLKQKNKDDKALSLGYFISGILGGVTEPVLYGVGMKYKKPFIALIIGGFVGGLYAGIMKVGTYVLGATNFLSVLGFVAGGTGNLVNGVIASAISMIVTAVITFVICDFKE